MPKKYAISDIHGCAKTFKALLEQIAFSTADQLYLLGDYIDRGPDTKGVIDTILGLQASGHAVYCLRGNHEQLFLDGFTDVPTYWTWRQNGGEAMLKSYGVAIAENIPPDHLQFLRGLAWHFEIDNYILVHGGVDFTRADDPLGDPVRLLWLRNWHHLIDYAWLGNRYIIHGHTPAKGVEILKQFTDFETKRWLDIDAGCFIKRERAAGYGYLCAFEMTEKQLFFQRNLDG